MMPNTAHFVHFVVNKLCWGMIGNLELFWYEYGSSTIINSWDPATMSLRLSDGFKTRVGDSDIEVFSVEEFSHLDTSLKSETIALEQCSGHSLGRVAKQCIELGESCSIYRQCHRCGCDQHFHRLSLDFDVTRALNAPLA